MSEHDKDQGQIAKVGELSSSLSGLLDRLDRVEQELNQVQKLLTPDLQTLKSYLEDQTPVLLGPSPQAGPEIRKINETIQKLAMGESQEQILETFLDEASDLVDRAILFLQKEDSYSPWKSLGFPSERLENLESKSSDDPIIRSAQQRRIIYRSDQIEEAFPWLTDAGETPKTAICVPFVFEDSVPLVFYGDSSKGITLDSVELLSHLTSLVLKNHYLQLLLESEAPDSAAVAASAAGVIEAPEELPSEAPEPVVEAPAPAEDRLPVEPPPPASVPDAPAMPPPESVVTLTPDTMPAAESADLETPPAPPEAPVEAAEVVEPTEEVVEPIEAEAPTPEPPPADRLSDFLVEEPTYEIEEEAVEEAPSLEVPPADIEAVPAASQGTADVAPFPGLVDEQVEEDQPEGSVMVDPLAETVPIEEEETVTEAEPVAEAPVEHGLSDEELERHHSEARRFARLLVSEIKLYNEESVDEGRQQQNIYERLKTDIDRSRAMYDKRVHPAVRSQEDHFHQELVRILAGNEGSRMGSEYPGPLIS